MLKIGITGGIGSGKTTVCTLFALLGAPVYAADDAAKRLMTDDPLLVSAILAAFGPASYIGEKLNRKYIAGIVFNDARQLAILNSLVHPAVFKDFARWCAEQTAPYVVKEAALLFESGSYRLCDQNILVQAPDALKIKRTIARDGSSEEEIRKRMAKQMTDDEKKPLADFQIINDEQTLVIPQVLRLHQQFSASSALL